MTIRTLLCKCRDLTISYANVGSQHELDEEPTTVEYQDAWNLLAKELGPEILACRVKGKLPKVRHPTGDEIEEYENDN